MTDGIFDVFGNWFSPHCLKQSRQLNFGITLKEFEPLEAFELTSTQRIDHSCHSKPV